MMPGEHKPVDAARELGTQLARTLDGTGLAFVLIVSDMGVASDSVVYASNAVRDGVLEVLERLTADLRRTVKGEEWLG